ncbi:NACHT domain-containing protein [Streptomyces sp. DK15]|uniref:NACHT domain-containing protein n=1 Tax=Streptomyces sp. DK15 TaxID=2957499 RepID=UPI0029ADE648|nr:NACHT domain-containing protein [Streptomyces sp. DK15]MDX2391586.1 NACHT domain-containing protein [Streptomyces sp. DK15]
MTSSAGFRPRGPQRPDPASVPPELRPWATLMGRVHDELYEGLDPADRPTVTALADAAHLSRSYVSEAFSGKRRPQLRPFLSMVTALRGDPAEWEPRWHRAAGEQESAATGETPEPVPPLPGVEDASPDEPPGGYRNEDGSAEGEPARRIPPPRSGAAGATHRPGAGGDPGAGLRRYPVRRFVRALLAWVLLAFTWPGRARRDRAAIRLRRRLVKQVRDRTAVEWGRAEAHLYLQPRFTILTADRHAEHVRGRRGRRARRVEPVAAPTPVTNIRTLFEDTDDLVLLGRPGMGKTTQLARLAHRLAVEALEGPDESEPLHVPVHLRLDTYRGEPFEEWLVNAMGRQYTGISGILVRTWLSEHRLLPVLDGLDEVPEADRSKCVAELRRLRRVCPGMAVGCRTDEADLRRLAFDLGALRYVEIQPPSRQDVQEFLTADRHALADVHVALEEDPDLWQLLRSPMMLGFISVTYRNRSADDLRRPGSPAERRGRIFDAYVRECLLRERRGGPDESPERTLTWLTWLARTLTERQEHVLYLDRLDLGWLPRAEQMGPRMLPNLAMSLCALGLPVLWVAAAVHAGVLEASVTDAAVLAAVMAVTCAVTSYHSETRFLRADEAERDGGGDTADGDRRRDRKGGGDGKAGRKGGGRDRNPDRGAIVEPVAATGPLMVLMVFLMVYVARIDLTAPGPLVVALAYFWVTATQMEGSFTDVFQPVEQMRWTWLLRERTHYSKAKFHLVRGAYSLFMWISIEALLGYVVHLLCPDPWWIGPAAAALLGIVYIVGNQFEPSLQDRRPRPNEGMRRTVRFSVVHGFAGLAVAVVGLMVLVGLATPDHDLRRAGFVAALLGVLFAVVRGFRFGGLAVLRHWTIRAILAHRGRTPYRYRRFLHAAEERVLLFRTDSGFFFPHRLLQLHLNTQAEHLRGRVTPNP